MKILGETPHNEIQNQKDSLPREEKVIDAAHESDRKSKYAFSVLVDGFFHGNQQQWKEGSNILKVVEKEVKQLKSRKRIQQPTNQGSVSATDKSLNISVSRHDRNAMLHREQYRKSIEHPAAGQNRGNPEERTA